MRKEVRKQDKLNRRFKTDEALEYAKRMLEAPDQSEEEFLGAQGGLLLHGLL